MQLIVSRKVPEAKWELKTLMAAIEEEIVARERLGTSRAPRRPDSKPLLTATTLVTRKSLTGPLTCCYCNQQHRPTDCTVVSQVDHGMNASSFFRGVGAVLLPLTKGTSQQKLQINQPLPDLSWETPHEYL